MILKYQTSTRTYGQPINITLDRLCNGITIKNSGNSICVFADDPLQPGESKAIGGNKGEILQGRYNVFFKPIASPPPGYVQNDECVVTQKYYTEGQPGLQ